MKVDFADPSGLERFKTLATTLKALFNDKDETDPRPTLLKKLAEKTTDLTIATTLLLVWKPPDSWIIDDFLVLTRSLERYLQFCDPIDSLYLEIKVDDDTENFDVFSTQHVETQYVDTVDFAKEIKILSDKNEDVQSVDLIQTVQEHSDTLSHASSTFQEQQEKLEGWTAHGKRFYNVTTKPPSEISEEKTLLFDHENTFKAFEENDDEDDHVGDEVSQLATQNFDSSMMQQDMDSNQTYGDSSQGSNPTSRNYSIVLIENIGRKDGHRSVV